MDVVRSMQFFVYAAETGSVAAASKKLGVSAPTGTRLLNDLEAWMDTTLVYRTTRRFHLTDAGTRQLPEIIKVLDRIDALGPGMDNKRQSLSVSVPTILARTILAPQIPRFLTNNPTLDFSMNVSDKRVDMLAGQFDLAIRIGVLTDSSLIARKIGEIKIILVAAPEFLKSHGRPRTADDIVGCPCIKDTAASFGGRWPFLEGATVPGNVTVNSGDVAASLAVSGLGLAYLPEPFVAKFLHEGQLEEISAPRHEDTLDVHAVYPPQKYVKDIAREFVDQLAFTGPSLYADPFPEQDLKR